MCLFTTNRCAFMQHHRVREVVEVLVVAAIAEQEQSSYSGALRQLDEREQMKGSWKDAEYCLCLRQADASILANAMDTTNSLIIFRGVF